ncbi:MAG: hypothetical protein QW429_06280 [Thermoprotei archaeon]
MRRLTGRGDWHSHNEALGGRREMEPDSSLIEEGLLEKAKDGEGGRAIPPSRITRQPPVQVALHVELGVRPLHLQVH